MYYLAIVSLIWAFSFGSIGMLAGIDSTFVAMLRLAIAGLVFLPFFRLSKVPTGSHLKLMGCGAVQFGVMYICYIMAFQFVPEQSHLVALFSITTPLYIVLIHDLRQGRFHRKYLYTALLAVAGAAVIKAKPGSMDSLWVAFALMQLAGLAFGFGQVWYRDWKQEHPNVQDHTIFALLYAGGFLTAALASSLFTDWEKTTLSPDQMQILAYLGIVASGLGFFLWNKGAALTRPSTLAAFNNAVVPLGMACSLFVFGEITEVGGGALIRLLLGSAGIAGAVILGEKTPRLS